jgi:hypothetical protein
MISAFKHIRLSGYNLLPQSVDGQTRLTLNSSGVAYFSELSTASGILNTKIDAFSGTFQSFVNNLDTQFATDAQLTAVSGALQTGINTVATNLGTTGSTLDTKIGSLSGYSNSTFSTILNLAATGSTLQSNINTVTTNLGTTGSTLDTKIGSLSGYSNSTFSTILNLAATGSTLQSNINTVTTNLGTTGSTLNTRINSLSGTLTSDYVQKATQQQFIVNLPINVESTGITFPVAFASTPNSVQVTFEPSTDVAYMVAVKNRTTAGFTAEFSDVLFEAGNKLNVFASV